MFMTNKLTNEQQAQIELKHIQIELKNNRDQHLRHFVDQYYCYKHGYVRGKDNRADWEAIVWNDRVSVEARKIHKRMESGELSKIEARKEVVKEHVVPLKVITELLNDLAKNEDTKPESIKRVLDKHIIFATITKDEDAELNKAGLRSKMRKEAIDGGKLVSDVFERYKTVKISLEHVGHTIDAKRIIRK
jgi:hypothetical protein